VDSPRDVERARQALHAWVLRLGRLNAAGRQGRPRHGAGASLRRIFDPIAGLPH
jgi:hypothetical protein